MCKPSDPRRRHLADQSNASKRHLIIMPTFVDVPEIKLIRTDTTLDLSQKAEKVCLSPRRPGHLYRTRASGALRARARGGREIGGDGNISAYAARSKKSQSASSTRGKNALVEG